MVKTNFFLDSGVKTDKFGEILSDGDPCSSDSNW